MIYRVLVLIMMAVVVVVGREIAVAVLNSCYIVLVKNKAGYTAIHRS